MATPAPEPPVRESLDAAARQVAEHASAIARLEVELAKLELRDKATSLAVGTGLGVGGMLTAFFALAFLLSAVAAALALVIPVWAALLVTAALLAGATAVLVLFARNRFQHATPPVPEAALEEARLTRQALRR
jgi:putative superfamily III holin-X